jgi:Zn-finger nucleic acid-binding protein
MTDRSGVEIDYCPKCRGVWLDRGELDKIIDRAAAASPPPPEARPAEPYRQEKRPDYDRDHGRHPQQPHYKKKRESFLGELFDF